MSSLKRASSLSRTGRRPSVATRAAASSMASGSPSSRRQMSITSGEAVVTQREARVDRPHPRLEQRHRAELARAARRRLRRHGERHDPVLLLGRQAQRLLAGRQQRDARARPARRPAPASPTASSRCSQLSSTSSASAARGRRRARPAPRPGPRIVMSSACATAFGSSAGSDRPGELDHPRAVRPAAGQRVRRRLRQAALADAAGAHDGHEPVRVDQRAQRGEVGVAAVEPRQLRAAGWSSGAAAHGRCVRRASRDGAAAFAPLAARRRAPR